MFFMKVHAQVRSNRTNGSTPAGAVRGRNGQVTSAAAAANGGRRATNTRGRGRRPAATARRGNAG